MHIDLAREVSFSSKAAIKHTLNQIPEDSKVIIDAKVRDYIALDILDLINEFKTTRAVDHNIVVKLKEFKKAYQLENTIETHYYVAIEHYYDAAKRVMIKTELTEEKFLKEDKRTN